MLPSVRFRYVDNEILGIRRARVEDSDKQSFLLNFNLCEYAGNAISNALVDRHVFCHPPVEGGDARAELSQNRLNCWVSIGNVIIK